MVIQSRNRQKKNAVGPSQSLPLLPTSCITIHEYAEAAAVVQTEPEGTRSTVSLSHRCWEGEALPFLLSLSSLAQTCPTSHIDSFSTSLLSPSADLKGFPLYTVSSWQTGICPSSAASSLLICLEPLGALTSPSRQSREWLGGEP